MDEVNNNQVPLALPFEGGFHGSPFELPNIQAHVASVVAESTAGKDQMKILSKDGCIPLAEKPAMTQPRKGQRTAPIPTPFEEPPPNVTRCVQSKGPYPPVDPTKRFFDWRLVEQMGSSMEDVLSIVTRMSSQSIGRADVQEPPVVS